MFDIDDLEQRLQRMRRKEGLIGGILKVRPVKPERGHISAHISPERWGSEITIDPAWEPEKDETLQVYAMCKGIDDIVVEVSKAAMKHEAGHWKHCPYDFRHHDIILEAVDKGLEAEGISEERREELRDYIANMFEDVVVNTNRMAEDGHAGQFMFFYDQGTSIGTYTPLYEAHVKLHARLSDDPLDEELVSRFYRANAETQFPLIRALNARASALIDEKVDLLLGILDIKGRELDEAVDILDRRGTWKKKAFEFAKALAEYIPSEEQQEDMQPEQLGPDPSSFDDEFNDERVQKQIVKGRLEAGEPLPSYVEMFESLDRLYSAISSEIELRAKVPVEGWDMPLVAAAHDIFDPAEHRPSDIDFNRLGFDPEQVLGALLGFEVATQHHTVSVPFRKARQRVPDIMYLFDCSGSMSYDGGDTRTIPWGVESKYHFAMLGIYGSLNWLQRKGLAPYLKYNGTLFSGSTKSSGWHGYAGLDKVKELFWQPEFGGTNLDLAVLKAQLKDKDPSVILMLSDGEIWNWNGYVNPPKKDSRGRLVESGPQVKDAFRELADRHLLSFIQIGKMSETAKEIRSWGKPVYQVKRADDTRQMIIDLTKLSVRNYLHSLTLAAPVSDTGYIYSR